MPWSTNSGHYILILQLKNKTSISIGKLGTFVFPPSTYCYVGRAKLHLRQRLARHLRQDKKTRWHIDHLIPHTQVIGVFLFPLAGARECLLAQKLIDLGGTPYPPRFGASDCRCKSHLIQFPKDVNINVLAANIL